VKPHQTTFDRAVSCQGIGLHFGAPATLTLRAAQPDTGIVFVRTDVDPGAAAVEAVAGNVVDTTLSTTLANAAGTRVATVEHLLAALHGLGIDNAIVEIDGPEAPIMDGSAEPFVALVNRAGIKNQAPRRRPLEVRRPIEVRRGDKWARIEPAPAFAIDVTIDFEARAVARQRYALTLGPERFAREIARARTFGFADEVERLRASGLARGGSLDNAVVVAGDRILNEGGLRYADEFVRHKVLDCLGDFYLAGAPILGRVTAFCTGHKLNHELIATMLADRTAWHRAAAVDAPAHDRPLVSAG
jgi:UDP-3-O-[3-hydroxymyristoyl] N-acetylglucosamine deacetylase